MAAFAITEPSCEFSVDTSGCACPAGHTLRKFSGPPRGTTVKLSEYAAALAGTPQELDGTGIVRDVFAARNGPPKDPFGFRVSRIRQGATATNCSGVPVTVGFTIAIEKLCGAEMLPCESSAVTLNGNEPAVVGVPLMMPVGANSVSPGGSDPDTTAQA